MSDENDKTWWKTLLKALGIMAAIVFLLVAVGFGLLIGFCGLLKR